MSSDGDEPRPLAATAAALVTLPVILGVLVGVALTLIAGGFAVIAGITGAGGGPAAQPSLYMPKYSPTPSEQPSESPSESPSEAPTSPTGSTAPQARKSSIELLASPLEAGKYEKITLSGTYLSGDGAVLQVQRRTGGAWRDFPVTVTVQGGSFTTYVQTGHVGKQKFRVMDTQSGRHSNAVTVTVS